MVNPMRTDPITDRFPAMFSECFDFSPPAGWRGIVERLCEKLAERPNLRVSQVKEKFGGLRVYLHAAHDLPEGEPTDWANEFVRDAEKEASTTCEQCGATGAKLRGRGWVSTLCDGCAK